jgi:hypothetical protein
VTTPAVATTYFDDLYIAAAHATITHQGQIAIHNTIVISTPILNGTIRSQGAYPYGTPDSAIRPIALLSEHIEDDQVNHRAVQDAFQRAGYIFSQLYSSIMLHTCRVSFLI